MMSDALWLKVFPSSFEQPCDAIEFETYSNEAFRACLDFKAIMIFIISATSSSPKLATQLPNGIAYMSTMQQDIFVSKA